MRTVSDREENVVGVILAAGFGTRFEGRSHKLLTTFRGSPMIMYSLLALRGSGIMRRAVVVGSIDFSAMLSDEETVLHNPSPLAGLSSSLSIARDWALSQRADAMVVGLADQPLIGSQAWARVAAAQGAPIMVATYRGRRRNPVKLSREVFDLLPDSGDEGARALYNSYPELVGEIECDGEPIDIDTVEELDEWNL